MTKQKSPSARMKPYKKKKFDKLKKLFLRYVSQ